MKIRFCSTWASRSSVFRSSSGSLSVIAVEAVSEVSNPTILATFAVIAAVMPMAFVGGLMGPYMMTIPIGAGAAMGWSLAIAFIVTPWAGALARPGSSHLHPALV